MIRELVIATHNAGKLREFESLLAPLGIAVKSAGQLGIPEPEETGATFAENAELKARYSMLASGLPALADDSGLVIPALGGAPGIYSARWAGPDKNFNTAFDRIEKELDAAGAPASSPAYFACALALAFPGGECIHFEGRAHGTLTFPPRGKNGFGYDPVFIPEGYDVTFAELEANTKQAISHRARAFSEFLIYMEQRAAS
ncbi:MAG: RdgB/HAM1 family non-canonical purine NTP pyrophosphatase [Alphaproteobacteria bacterium]|nr:RdgB/HAM1 family non-canonical purine NTP pyrophosphatase [Alphaproteobacteria bacterium]